MRETAAVMLGESYRYTAKQAAALQRIAGQLDKWADETREGGWSTHQLEPMRRLAQEIRGAVALGRPDEILAERL